MADGKSPLLPILWDKKEPQIVWMPWLKPGDTWIVGYTVESWASRIMRLEGG